MLYYTLVHLRYVLHWLLTALLLDTYTLLGYIEAMFSGMFTVLLYTAALDLGKSTVLLVTRISTYVHKPYFRLIPDL